MFSHCEMAKLWLVFGLLILVAATNTPGRAQGLQPPDQPAGVAEIAEKQAFGWQYYQSDSLLFYPSLTIIKREVAFDSTRQYVSVSEKLNDKSFRLPVRMSVEEYVEREMRGRRRNQWRQSVVSSFQQRDIAQGGTGIELNIPLKIKNSAFKRIFGGDRVGLRVSGNISFELAGRTESREGSAVSSIEQRGRFSPKFKQTQQFRVEGRVGDKVTVSVDQNSEATFDFENTLKLTYEGDEDEIVQRIEAGNVGLSLPSTEFVSTSANHQGLFGIKTQMQVGNLSFTGIASLERGENQSLSISGSSRENKFRIRDYEYVKNRFFFIDDIYQAVFESQLDVNRMILQDIPEQRVQQLDIWRTVSGTVSFDETFEGYAVLDPDQYLDINGFPNTPLPTGTEGGAVETGRFKRLVPDVDYVYDYQRGYFQLKTNVADNEVLAVAYKRGPTLTQSTQVGMPYQAIDSLVASGQDPVIVLRIIKPAFTKPSPDPYGETWKLAMRNVYNLQGSGISEEGFDIDILYTVTGDDQDVDAKSGKAYLNLLGLDRVSEQGQVQPDNKPDLRRPEVFNLTDGYLVFPTLQPFDPPEGSPFGFDPERHVDIYEIDDDLTLEQERSKFELEVTTTASSNSFDLGFNVLDGSEKVRLNGRELQKDRDYIIDYFSGKLEVTAQEARRADAQIEIEYERGALFQLDKKTLLGGRLDYKFNDTNFIGLTGIFYSKSTLDQRVRLGQEPIRNFIWDVNTAFQFKPNFITKAFDKLPIVKTNTESRLKLEAEYAQVNPNPNTFNEDDLGDTDGVAYIDDFEGSKRFTSLGINYRIWSEASVPMQFNLISDPTINYQAPPGTDVQGRQDYIFALDRNRVNMYWYNPFTQVDIRSIWPDKDVNARTGTTTNVLNLEWTNDDLVGKDSAWAGIMRSTATFADQKKTKFIELWIRGEVGQVNVDIGTISEDFYVRGEFPAPGSGTPIPSYRNLNSEDRNFNGILDRDGVDGTEDTGIDGVAGVDGTNVPNDAGDDDWAAPNESNFFRRVNGTEGNGQAQGATYPDTEDLDGDNSLNVFNDYFTYSFDLAEGESSPFFADRTISNEGPTGWKLYRIPIREYTSKFGNPDTTFKEIRFARLWINDLPVDQEINRISIATFDFVGNEWEERGFARSPNSPVTLDEERFGISVANTEENAEYVSPPNVSGIKDRITQAVSKEQSLVLNLLELPAGSRVEAKKQLRERVSLLNYKRLKMFVFGDEQLLEDDSLVFFIRFGATENSYYEYRQPVYQRWSERNNIELDFNELAATKGFPQINPATNIQDILRGQPVFSRMDPAAPEKQFVVVGNPGLHNINYFIVGAINARQEGDIRGRPVLRNMEIWLDELRVTGVERESGSAMRVKGDLVVADIGTFTADWRLTDDEFRKAEQQYASSDGKGQTTQRQNYFGSLKLGKFLPESWGVSIPLTGRFSNSMTIPKYLYNSDQLTGYEIAGIGQRAEAFFGIAGAPDGLEEEITKTENRSLGTTVSRRDRNKDPWFLRYTVNQVTLDADYREQSSSNPTQLFNDSRNINTSLDYKVPFGKPKSVKPFGWLGDGIFKGLSSQKLYLTPQSANMNLSLSDNEQQQRNRLEPDSVETIPTVTVKTTRKFTLKYKMLESLSFDYNRDYTSDPRLQRNDSLLSLPPDTLAVSDENPFLTEEVRFGDVVRSIFTEFDFGENNSVRQSFSANYSPRLSTWLNSSYNYNSSFIYSLQNPNINSRTASLNRNQNVSVNFKPSTLVNIIHKPGSKPRTGTSGSRGGRKSSGKSNGDDDDNKEDKKKSGPGIPNPAMLLWHTFDKIKSVAFDFRFQDAYASGNLNEIPDWGYQFGFSDEPGAATDVSFQKALQPANIKNVFTLDGDLQVDLIKNLTSTFKYNKQVTDNQLNNNNTQLVSNTVFFTGDDPRKGEQTWWALIPDWRFSLSGVEKLPLFKAFTKTASLEHARNGKYSVSKLIEGDVETKENESYSISFQPFIGLNFTTRWGVTGSFRSNRSTSFTYRTAGGTSKQEQSGMSITAAYSVSKGFNLPLPFLKNKKLNNEIQFSLSFDRNNSSDFSRRSSEADFEIQSKVESWKLRPSISYRFSQKVNGTAFYEQSTSSNLRTGTLSYKEFGINVNIAIR